MSISEKIFGYLVMAAILGVAGFLIYYYGKDFFKNGPLSGIMNTLSAGGSIISGVSQGTTNVVSEIPLVGGTLGAVTSVPSALFKSSPHSHVVPLKRITPDQLM